MFSPEPNAKPSLTRTAFCVVFAFLLSFGALLFLGISAERSRAGQMVDFEIMYFGSRLLIQHHDPYNPAEFLSAYEREGAEFRSGQPFSEAFKKGSQFSVNFPTTLWFVAPLAILPWGPAHVIWMVLTASSLLIAACLVCALAWDHSKPVALVLSCFWLANCEILVAGGNIAGLVVGLCIVSVWCFSRDRLIVLGIVCLALSLALKPHDSGFVFAYFLFAGSKLRKRALAAACVLVSIAAPAVLWVSGVAPNWMAEQKANLAGISATGAINNMGSVSGHDPHTLINLQTVISLFTDEPKIYNLTSYLICGFLFLACIFVTMRSAPTGPAIKLALATISALTMLPIYHRFYDAKLLLLTVPACAMLWAGGGAVGRVALVLNSAAIFLTADLPALGVVILTRGLGDHATSGLGELMTIAVRRPYPLILLATAVFYVSVNLLRHTGGDSSPKLGIATNENLNIPVSVD